MKMRSLNTLARGVAAGYGEGSQITNRRRLTDMEGERLGIAKDTFGLAKQRDEREGKFYEDMTEFMKKWSPTVAATTASVTQQPAPDAQSFMSQQPAPVNPFAAQPGLATSLMQPQRRQLPSRLPFTDVI